MKTGGAAGQAEQSDGPAGPAAVAGPGSRAALYDTIREDGQRLALGLIQYLHAGAERSDLNPTDFQCLVLLRLGGPKSPSEIATWLRLASGSVTGVIDRLESRGLAHRDRHAQDRRRIVVRVSERARTSPGSTSAGMREAMTDLHDGYSEEELRIVADWLGRLNETLLEVAAAPRT